MDKLTSIIRYSLLACFLSTVHAIAAQPGGQSVANAPQQSADVSQQRELFKKAEYAARRGRIAEYNQLLAQLENYPLKPYLELERLQQIGYLANEDRVVSFLEQYKGTPLDWQLRQPWLDYLANQGEYQRFIRDFRHPGTLTHQCYLIEAERARGLQDGPFIRKVDAIWRHGFSVPSACDGILNEWADLGARTKDKVWQRLVLAAEDGNPTLIPYLTSLLPNKEQYLGDLYYKVRYSPAAIGQLSRFRGVDAAKEAQIATFALTKLIWRAEELALKAYERLVSRLPFTAAQRHRIAEEFAVALSLKEHPEARVWHQKVPPSELDERVLQWRLAAYLRDHDFAALKMTIQTLPPAISGGNQWQYWLARAMEETGDKLNANKIYSELAKERHYYGFLAAARIGAPVSLEKDPVKATQTQITTLLERDDVKRAYEFLQLGRDVDARREWNHLLSDIDGEAFKTAAVIASDWGWHDQAIWTLAQIGHFDAVEIRFPMAYSEIINLSSEKYGIDPAWAMAITRRESSFRADAYSGAGARGLMQILPGTAKLLRNDDSFKRLNTPEVNVALGTYYLSRLKERFDGNHVLATAAYNAGYYKVKDWLPSEPTALDEWVEMIPYYETRDYVKAVLSYQQIYELLNGKEVNLFDAFATMRVKDD
ncbi:MULTISPECIES: transglycosylase SLT domain-containing protein [Idiomarina]|uniref:transglycosylase SLT domain-containing protein n=1 Tax=Idiomarina TaxID=135575 RepID=UPI0023558453|nr:MULTISPECIES: transglycosylase SLT domain-containing protein [Idiomarina]|tara:strand:- start:230 stop:2191 length:1962 start_codon:yes stop_codon:yes gene_type:complete